MFVSIVVEFYDIYDKEITKKDTTNMKISVFIKKKR